MSTEPEPCAYCDNKPTLLKPEPTGTEWDHAGRYVCLHVGCPGQGSRKLRFGYARVWNTRQKQLRSAIDKARAVVLPLVTNAV